MTTTQPELYTILMKQHREVDGMLSQLAELEHAAARKSLFAVLKQQLMSHAKAEEKTFYDKLDRAGEKHEAKHAKHEHREIEEAIAEVDAVSFDDDGAWASAIANLTKTVKHHVEDEESDVFEAGLETLGVEKLDELAEQFKAQRLVELEKLGGVDDNYGDLTKDELLEEARQHDVAGRSSMSKDQLVAQLRTLQ